MNTKKLTMVIILFLLLIVVGTIMAAPPKQGDVVIPGPDPYPTVTWEVIEMPDETFRKPAQYLTIIINE